MVGVDAQELEAFLHRNAHSAAATPQTNEKIGLETGVGNSCGELEGISQEVVRGDESFCHCFSEAQLR
jgi:hypothetical protein